MLETLEVLLAELETEWRRLNAPIMSGLRPGLAYEQIDALGEEFGIRIPPELRVWWHWHDGAENNFQRSIGPGMYEFLSLREALEGTIDNRQTNPWNEVEGGWREERVLFLQMDASWVYVADRFPYDECQPIGAAHHAEDDDLARAHSLTECVSLWVWAMQQGYFGLDSFGQLSSVGYETWPLWLRLIML